MRRIVVLLTLLLMTPAACGQGGTVGGAHGDEALPGTGKVADYDFVGTTTGGEELAGADLAGRPAVLWFWSPWCPTCRAQAPTVSRLADEYDGQVAVVGVGGLDDHAAIEDLAVQIPHVTHLVDAEGEVWQHFGVTGQSTYTVIDAQGRIVTEGFLDNDEIAALVDRLADQPGEDA